MISRSSRNFLLNLKNSRKNPLPLLSLLQGSNNGNSSLVSAFRAQPTFLKYQFSAAKNSKVDDEFVHQILKRSLELRQSQAEDPFGHLHKVPNPFYQEPKPKKSKNKKKDEDDEEDHELDLAGDSPARKDKQDPTQKVLIQKLEISSEEHKLLKTHYGDIKVLHIDLKKLKKAKNVYFLSNNSNRNYLKRIFRKDKNSIILMTPDMHFKSCRTLYENIRKIVTEGYFGTAKKPKNPFRNCQTRKQVYHLSRMIEAEQKTFLDRICVIATSEGHLRVKGVEDPSSAKIKNFGKFSSKLAELSSDSPSEEEYYSRDILLPFGEYLKAKSNESFVAAGAKLQALGGKQISIQAGVWPPTQQHVYSLFKEFVGSKLDYLSEKKAVLDIGAGTGVLSLIYCDLMLNRGARSGGDGRDGVFGGSGAGELVGAGVDFGVTCMDVSGDAVECVASNKTLFNFEGYIEEVVGDVVELVKGRLGEGLEGGDGASGICYDEKG